MREQVFPVPSKTKSLQTFTMNHRTKQRIAAIITMAPVYIRSTDPAYIRELLDAAESLSDVPRKYGKPLIATAMRGQMQGVAFELMRERGIPFYEFPEEAARAMYGLYRYSRLQ